MLECSTIDAGTARRRQDRGVLSIRRHPRHHDGRPNKLFYCGGLGNGLAAKISNNYLAGTILLAIAEALAIGIRSGIDKHLLYQTIRHSSGQSWMCNHVHLVPGVVAHVPSSNDYAPGFKTQMMIKDTLLGMEAGPKTGIEPTMARAVMEVYRKAAHDPVCKVTSSHIYPRVEWSLADSSRTEMDRPCTCFFEKSGKER
ncbi:hypothetical protein VTN77DRAFT_4322 [Rasamsonia byssochlamydoides]|uniref:uncharacterized protein n=1 Tax=Rasamsonia byssochlamydoides TaxID=89139 RepID=UPI0037435513